MTPGTIADSMVNICGAIGVAVAMASLYRRAPGNPLSMRVLVMLGLVSLLFLTRGLAWWSDSVWLDRLSLLPAALLPLGALLVAEGMLRRHAPRAAKIAITLAAIVLGIGGALGLDSFAAPYAVALSAFQLAGIGYCAFLLATRDRGALTAAENQSIHRLAIGALITLPFLLTDFRTLFPDIPVRLGGLGALLVVSAVLTDGGSGETTRQSVVLNALRIAGGALLGAGATWMSPDADAAQVLRFCVVGVSGVLAIGLMVDAPALDLRGARAGHPELGGTLRGRHARYAAGRAGAPPDFCKRPTAARRRACRLRSAAHARVPVEEPLLRQAEAPWGLVTTDPAVERLVSLMRAGNATHLIVLSHDPVDLVALTVPVTSADPATETALALVRRLLVLTPEQPA